MGASITRFVPLPHTIPLPQRTVTWNISVGLTRISPGHRAGGTAGALPDVATLLGVLFMVAVALYALWVVASTVHIGREGGESLFISRSLRRGAGKGLGYVYKGMALALRKMYLALREEMGCSSCTPRELSQRAGGALNLFAELYEKAVYSARHLVDPGEVRKVEELISRFLRGSRWRGQR